MMTLSRHVLPYFHQSTIIVIDDDREFLESFRSRFRRRMLCRAFGDPEEAIRHIRKTTPRMPRHSGCVVPGDLVSSDGDQAVVFRPAVIRDLMHDANRFEEVSVAVIDYDMPGINGLEVCRRLRDLPLRKVMLTGAADEKLAMGAFNEGLIDRFVLKQEADAVDRLEEVIHQLQVDYFGRIGNELSSLIGLNESAFLVDPVFHKYFDTLMERENAVEYFLSENPPGLQLVRGDGVVRTLLVQHYGAPPAASRRGSTSGFPPATVSPGFPPSLASTRKNTTTAGGLISTQPNGSAHGIAASSTAFRVASSSGRSPAIRITGASSIKAPPENPPEAGGREASRPEGGGGAVLRSAPALRSQAGWAGVLFSRRPPRGGCAPCAAGSTPNRPAPPARGCGRTPPVRGRVAPG